MLLEAKNWFVIKCYHDIIKANQKNKHYVHLEMERNVISRYNARIMIIT